MPRMKLIALCVPVVSLGLLMPAVARAQGPKGRTIHGTVTNAQNQPIAYALISVGKGSRQLSDNDGKFELALPNKKAITLDVRHIGFTAATLKIDAGGDTAVTVQLPPGSGSGVPSAKLLNSGFYDRMKASLDGSGPGRFITAEEIEQRKFPRITQLIDGTPGVRINRTGSIGGVPLGQGQCLMETYVDGTRTKLFMPAGGPSSGSSLTGNIDRANSAPQLDPNSEGLDNFIPSSNVLGIEVYARPAEAPGKFQSLSGTCGVIVIWLK